MTTSKPPARAPLILLHQTQLDFLNCPEPFAAFVGGIGSGKSFVLCYDLLKRARPRSLYMVIAPTYRMMQDATMRSFTDLARQIGVRFSFSKSDHRITLERTGAEILFRSGDNPESLRGPNLSGVALDEASLMHNDVYNVCIGRLRQGRQTGFLRAAFTPKGPSHWTCEVFASGAADTALFRCRTFDNPFLPAGFAEKVANQYGDTNFARQELDGEFLSLEGAEFDASWFTGDDLWFDAWPTQGIQLAVRSLDPSKGTDGLGRDYQAHVDIAAVIEGGRWVYYVDADLRREGVVPMCERAVMGCRAFHTATGRPIDSLVIEDNATMGLLPAQLAAACAKLQYAANWSCRTSTANKNQRIMAWVGPPLSRRQLRFRRTPGARMLVGQMQSWPSCEFDDGPDALAAALRRLTELMGA